MPRSSYHLPVDGGRHETERLRILVAQLHDAPAHLARERDEVVAQRGVEAPFSLGRARVGGGRRPAREGAALLREERLHALAALQVLAFRRAADGAELEDGALVRARDGPLARAVHDIERRADPEMVDEELAERRRQAAVLEPEIAHRVQHQAVLVRVLDVMDRDFRIRFAQRVGDAAALAERALGVVGIARRRAHGAEERLRQPGRAQRGGQMDHRAVRRADERALVGARRIEAGDPLRDGLDPQALQVRGVDALAHAAEDEEPLAQTPRQRVDGGQAGVGQRGLGRVRDAFAAQRAREGLRHGGGGIEAGDARGRLAHRGFSTGAGRTLTGARTGPRRRAARRACTYARQAPHSACRRSLSSCFAWQS